VVVPPAPTVSPRTAPIDATKSVPPAIPASPVAMAPPPSRVRQAFVSAIPPRLQSPRNYGFC